MKRWLALLGACNLAGSSLEHALPTCLPTVTIASGVLAPKHFCSGDLIFSEEFTQLNHKKWQHEYYTDREFQCYVNSTSNSFVYNGNLHVRALIRDVPPFVTSARIRTKQSFRFAYGRLEVRAKMPAGDWLFPAIWLMPAQNAYGKWPTSGEMDLVECRGNRHLMLDQVNIGVEKAGSTLHYGPSRDMDGWRKATWSRSRRVNKGYDKKFHRYQLQWTPEYIGFSIDDVDFGRIAPGAGGFWEYGGFGRGRNIKNPWILGTKMAPFDKEFYIIINLAVGGISYFTDAAINPIPKPWSNRYHTKRKYWMEQAQRDFLNGQAGWLPTWYNNFNDDADLQVDYVRVWAL